MVRATPPPGVVDVLGIFPTVAPSLLLCLIQGASFPPQSFTAEKTVNPTYRSLGERKKHQVATAQRLPRACFPRPITVLKGAITLPALWSALPILQKLPSSPPPNVDRALPCLSLFPAPPRRLDKSPLSHFGQIFDAVFSRSLLSQALQPNLSLGPFPGLDVHRPYPEFRRVQISLGVPPHCLPPSPRPRPRLTDSCPRCWIPSLRPSLRFLSSLKKSQTPRPCYPL